MKKEIEKKLAKKYIAGAAKFEKKNTPVLKKLNEKDTRGGLLIDCESGVMAWY